MESHTPLKRARLLAQISQTRLAKTCGIHRNYLARLEAGLSLPTVLLAQRLARELGTTVEALWPLREGHND